MTTRPPAGLQHERTALAWQRTALSLLVASVALTRFAYEQVGFAGLTCLLAVPLTGDVLVRSARAHRRQQHSTAAGASGLPGLALVLAVLLMCVTALAVIVPW